MSDRIRYQRICNAIIQLKSSVSWGWVRRVEVTHYGFMVIYYCYFVEFVVAFGMVFIRECWNCRADIAFRCCKSCLFWYFTNSNASSLSKSMFCFDESTNVLLDKKLHANIRFKVKVPRGLLTNLLPYELRLRISCLFSWKGRGNQGVVEFFFKVAI